MLDAQRAGVGDIHSDARGSGARFNVGKPPFELVPLNMVQEFYMLRGQTTYSLDPLSALGALGNFHRRAIDRPNQLLGVLFWLGDDGWAECAHVFDYGRKKYAAWNWAKGMAWSIPTACAVRHLLAMVRGEVNDPESGLPHRGHVFCNIVMLYTFCRTFEEGDDRPPQGLL